MNIFVAIHDPGSRILDFFSRIENEQKRAKKITFFELSTFYGGHIKNIRLGSGMREAGSVMHQIFLIKDPGPGVKMAPDPESRIRIRNTVQPRNASQKTKNCKCCATINYK
jgi:hypothetical protein